MKENNGRRYKTERERERERTMVATIEKKKERKKPTMVMKLVVCPYLSNKV